MSNLFSAFIKRMFARRQPSAAAMSQNIAQTSSNGGPEGNRVEDPSLQDLEQSLRQLMHWQNAIDLAEIEQDEAKRSD